MQKKKGISLIVLVITIIVMIILAGAVIISLNNSGIIDRAGNAVYESNESEINHIAQLAWSEAYLKGEKDQGKLLEAVTKALTNNGVNPQNYIIKVTTNGVTILNKNALWIQNGTTITKGNVTLEAGDLIQYNAGVSGYTGEWKILGAEDGNLLIMSTKDINTLKLHGLEGDGSTTNYGLLNGLDRLDEICKAYKKGTGAVGARSIKAEDIDKLTGFDKTTYGTNTINEYGNKITYSWNSESVGNVKYTSTNGVSGGISRYYLHNNEFDYIDFNTMTKKTVAVNGEGMPTLVCTHYSYKITDTTLTSSPKAIEMILGEYNESTGKYANKYWLADVSFSQSGSFLVFSLRFIDGDNSTHTVSPLYIMATGTESPFEYGVRPVVELSPNIKIGEKDNTLGWSYTI